ncbi:hypothetical protein [Paucibacter sp. KBW04]|uniref:hypothetical protein n=1 Tax=Paucibacter sp. KBW04 TaxID=2153361 RepID=UPI000F5797FD|nr:hypothetical protein [Paucibacter sp. KBW04]
MNASTLPGRHRPKVNLGHHAQCFATLLAVSAIFSSCTPAHAVDGCTVLLCFAAPSWKAIPQCVPPIRQVLRDLARGKAFPSCAMSGAGNSAGNQWAHAPSLCPPQYTLSFDGPFGPVHQCLYSGAISVSVNGETWSRTWWDLNGGSVTEFSATAKQQICRWDTQFDDDYARWLATQPPPSACLTC